MKQVFLFTIFFSIIFTSQNSLANNPTKTRITSDIIDIKRDIQQIDFLKNVIVKSESDMMTAQKMTVFYKDNENSQNSQDKGAKQDNSIEKIVATGDVKIFNDQFVATADSGYYDPQNSLFVLEKKVVVNNGDSIGTGEKFIYNLKTELGSFVTKNKNPKSKTDERITIIIGDETKKDKK